MIIEPKIRGFICVTAHPTGCAANVQHQIDHVVIKGAIPSDRKRVLVLGCSTGYGLASRIVSTLPALAADEEPMSNFLHPPTFPLFGTYILLGVMLVASYTLAF